MFIVDINDSTSTANTSQKTLETTVLAGLLEEAHAIPTPTNVVVDVDVRMATAAPQPAGKRKPARVILVVADPRNIALAGFEVVHCAPLSDVLSRIQQEGEEAQAILFGLDRADGLSSLSDIQNAAPRLPLIAVCSPDDEDLAIEAVRQGAQDYIILGEMDVRLIARTINTAIERKKISERISSTEYSYRKRSEEARRAMDAAEQANRSKSEFLSRMSHELRTPMNAMLGFAQLLEMDDLTAAQRESTGHILRAGRHLLNLINEVLDIARIEEGYLSLSVEPIPIRNVIKECLDLMQPLAGQQDITILADIKWLGDRHVMADRQRLQQVLLNLLSNSIKYNHRGETVRLFCEELASGHLRIAVRDNGPGIALDKMARLFQPFERLGVEQHAIEGTGLGLALSKRLVEAMGGAIGVESQAGLGSTFWIDLPLVEGQVERFERLGTEPLSPLLLTDPALVRNVHYIEDNLSNLRLVGRIVEMRPDVRLLSATTGERGLEMAREHKPALILLDLHLPDMLGDEVLRQLFASPQASDIPIIILSADATHTQVERLLAAGAYAYLTKPLNVKRLLQLLEETLHPVRKD